MKKKKKERERKRLCLVVQAHVFVTVFSFYFLGEEERGVTKANLGFILKLLKLLTNDVHIK